MRVSIITVCLNSESTIADTIQSVRSQTHGEIEHIVIDGGSTDKTLSVIEAHADHSITVVSERDNGIYDAMNKGISLAGGTVIGILNSDDCFESRESVERVVNEFANRPEVQIVFGDLVMTPCSDLGSIRRYYSSAAFAPWKLRFGWMPPHPATFVRRAVYETYGLYRSDYQISADYERFVRWLLVERLRYRRIDRVLVRMRQGGASTSSLRSNWILNREIVKACRENGIYTNEVFLLAKIPFKLMELVRRPAKQTND